MRVAILDACFPLNNQTTGVLAVQYLKWNLAKYGVEITNPKDADVIMVTCTSPINTPFVKRIRKMYPSNKIIVGGAGSTSPYSFSMYSDAVCVGDGQQFIRTMCTDGIDAAISLPNSFVYGETRKVEVDQGFPWGMPPIQAEDGIYRVWCGRGCKNRCVFCQTAWAHTYSENPNPDRLIHQIEYLLNHNHKVNYLSNDPAQHSFYNRLPPVGHGSYSFRFLKKNGLPPAREIRMGVEGVSERLRAAVGKPIPHDDLVGCTSWLNTNHKGVRWFMIAGLPGETESDWVELKQAVKDWKERTPKGVLGISFTAWCPDPATPISTLPVLDDYWDNFTEFKEWFFSGVGWSNRIKLMMPQNPKTRIIKAELAMGITEAELREGGHPGPNQRVNYPYANQLERVKNRYISMMNHD